jgi:hypothetical protein
MSTGCNPRKDVVSFSNLSHQTYEQLVAILDETAEWTLLGERGKRLGSALTLRAAVEQAMVCQASNWSIMSLCRQPDDEIIVFLGQINRLSQAMLDLTLPAVP